MNWALLSIILESLNLRGVKCDVYNPIMDTPQCENSS